MHPHLSFDLLRAQMDASKEIGVNVPIYLSAGFDDMMGDERFDWREITAEGCFTSAGPTQAGFRAMCFHSPYLDYLCDQIREAVRLFPEADGVFLDIVSQDECCCKWCIGYMDRHGLDAGKLEDRQACAKAALQRYYSESTAACRCDNPAMPVFHNSGHVTKGDREILQYHSHLELESLPTGGWGYDHFPLSAKYAQQTGLDFLGMTGKFHTTWGEFGGYKHPNALRYECASMLAFGSKCSVGDQLHPSGLMDPSTYEMIGQAFAEVEAKEPWCDNVTSVADIAVLSAEAETGIRDASGDTGAGRVLLESHFLFDVVDRQAELAAYKLLILPDSIRVDDALQAKIEMFLASGGKLLLTGTSGLKKDGSGFAFDVGAEHDGESEFQPDYVEMGELAPSFIRSPVVMYMRSQRVRPTSGEVLAHIREPYFNRTWKRFCSHQHAPAASRSEYAAAVRNGNILYMAHPAFSIYAALGTVAYKRYIANAIRLLLEDQETLRTNLPSTARVSITNQAEHRRYVMHLLHANTMARGEAAVLSPEGHVRDSRVVQVIEDLLPVSDVEISVKLPQMITSATLEPQAERVELEKAGDRVALRIEAFTCHQIVVLNY